MENDFGYQKVAQLSVDLSKRGNALAKAADSEQASKMKAYLESQQTTLDKTEALLATYKKSLTKITERAMNAAGEKASRRILSAYEQYGLKEE